MVEKLIFQPKFRIVSMIQFRDFVLLATEHNVYRIWSNDLTNELLFVEIPNSEREDQC